jgi:hypothetical protein
MGGKRIFLGHPCVKIRCLIRVFRVVFGRYASVLATQGQNAARIRNASHDFLASEFADSDVWARGWIHASLRRFVLAEQSGNPAPVSFGRRRHAGRGRSETRRREIGRRDC